MTDPNETVGHSKVADGFSGAGQQGYDFHGRSSDAGAIVPPGASGFRNP